MNQPFLELKELLKKEGFDASETSICQWRNNMGWTSKGTRYCQMIQDINKEKRLNFSKENKDMTLQDTIYTDETTVQIEEHRRMCCYKRGCKPGLGQS